MAGVVLTARRSRLLLIALVAAHLVAISGQVDGGQGTSLLGRIILSVSSPPQRLASALVSGVGGLWSTYVGLRGVRRENLELRRRVGDLETQLQLQQRQAQGADRLRDLLDLQQVLPLETVAAEVVSRDALRPWFRMLLINKGSEAGIHTDMPVIAPSGVIGRVVAVGPGVAKVQTLLDQYSGIGVLIERSRVSGVVSGQLRAATEDAQEPMDIGSDAVLMMKYVLATADVVEGDAVVTSGLDRIYPKGLLVGRVRSLAAASGLFKDVWVTPAARFDDIEEVLLLTQSKEQPIFTDAVGPEAR